MCSCLSLTHREVLSRDHRIPPRRRSSPGCRHPRYTVVEAPVDLRVGLGLSITIIGCVGSDCALSADSTVRIAFDDRAEVRGQAHFVAPVDCLCPSAKGARSWLGNTLPRSPGVERAFFLPSELSCASPPQVERGLRPAPAHLARSWPSEAGPVLMTAP
jgi:hypothetical protein